MIISQPLATAFIERYKNFLLFIYGKYVGSDEKLPLLMKLQEARSYYQDNRKVFDEFVQVSGTDVAQIDEAIRTIVLDSWIYLRNTAHYSLFIKHDGSVSMAVKGLLQPIKQIVGISGVYITTGVTTLGRDYICDGIMLKVIKLGKGYRSSYNDEYKKLKECGLFFRYAQ